MSADVSPQRVLVTGAARGIGAGIALAFGQRGARVVVHYHSSEDEARATVARICDAGGEAVALRADLRSDEALDGFVTEALAVWDGLDVLVNNAGVALQGRASQPSVWDETLRVNATVPYELSRRIAARMIEDGVRGSIVNISSILGVNTDRGWSAYSASKAALISATKTLALEWAPHGVRVNAIAPGAVVVSRNEAALMKHAEAWREHIPLGRFGTPADIGALAVFLCQDEASWITGQTIVSDGGMSVRLAFPIVRLPTSSAD